MGQQDGEPSASAIEKVYLHFDRATYKNGQRCWYKAYVISGSNFKLSNISRVLYVDWLDQHFNLIEQQKLKITNGQAAGEFTFSKNALSGIYIVRAYTRWMRNEDAAFFFKKVFNTTPDSTFIATQPARNNSSQVYVSFFPEGGRMVQGIETRVALRASNEYDEGVDISGEIIDERGVTINRLVTAYRGMAVFPFIPGNGKYSLKLASGKTFALPNADRSGVVLNVNNSNRDNIVVSLNTSTDNVNKAFTLVGSAANELCYRGKLVLKKTHSEFSIKKTNLPSGVVHLRLLDDNDSPVCERMVFVNNINEDYARLQQDIQEDSVWLNIQTGHPNGKRIEANMSVSISNDTSAEIKRHNNIFSYLLLGSELKTPIEVPVEYMDSHAPRNTFIMDLVMLTHEFRKNDPKAIAGNYQPELGLSLMGKAMDAYSKKSFKEGTMTLVIDDRHYKGIYTSDVDKNGNFKIEDIDYGDSTLLVWQYQDKKGKIQRSDVELFDSGDVPLPDTTMKLLVGRILAQRKMSANNGDAVPGDDSYQLLEKVVVTGTEKKVRALGAGSILVIPGKDDMKLPASQFVSGYAIGLPFLKPVTLQDGSVIWLTTSNKAVTLFIDGYEVDEFKTGTNPYHYLMAYGTDEIEYIVVTGSNHTGYSISVKTNQNALRWRRNFVGRFAHGYKTFHSFDPERSSLVQSAQHETTIYWNPDLITDDNGGAIVIARAVMGKPLSMVLQGIGAGGEIIDQTIECEPVSTAY
jgi:hypothetical protein